MASLAPRRADAQRNRERLLAAAETAFNAQGAGASLDDIAKAAGVGNATLYRHFPTRAKLLEAVYDQRIAELCAAAADLAQTAAPARALRDWLRAVVAHVTSRRVLTDAFLAACEGPAGTEPPQFAAWHNALFDAGRPLLAAAQDAGTARRDVDIAELLALVTGVARAGSPAQAERFLSVLLEGVTPRLPDRDDRITGSGQLELDAGDLLGQRREPGTGPVVRLVEVIAAVGLLIGEVSHDREAPGALAQPQVVTEGVAKRSRAVEVTELLLDLRDQRGVLARLELDEHDIPDHVAILGARQMSLSTHALSCRNVRTSVTVEQCGLYAPMRESPVSQSAAGSGLSQCTARTRPRRALSRSARSGR